MYGKSITKNDYFLKFIYANTKDINCHLIKNNLQKYTFQEEKYMSTWNNLQIMYYRNWFYLGRKQKMLHVEILEIKANKKC